MNGTYNRRSVLGSAAAIVTMSLAGCAGDDDSGDGDGDPETPEERAQAYLDDVGSNLYEGEIEDFTGESDVTVMVGAGSNDLAFDPPAIRIDAGTTVVWEWTGDGGGHNVNPALESDFDDFGESDIVSDAGHTAEFTFDEAGAAMYECEPHRAQGMHGAIVVE